MRHALPEPGPPPNWGFSYEQYGDDISKWSAEKLSGHLACLEDNIKENTMPVAMEKALREAKEARRDEIVAYKLEYSRRNKSYFWEELDRMAEKRKQQNEAEDSKEEGEAKRKRAKVINDATLAQRAE